MLKDISLEIVKTCPPLHLLKNVTAVKVVINDNNAMILPKRGQSIEATHVTYEFGNLFLNDPSATDTLENGYFQVSYSIDVNTPMEILMVDVDDEINTVAVWLKADVLHTMNENYIQQNIMHSVDGGLVLMPSSSAVTYSFAEGYNTQAKGGYAHAEGNGSKAIAFASHAEGNRSSASGYSSHAEGNNSEASGYYAHAEGTSSVANGDSSHAEGGYTQASGSHAHAEGDSSSAQGDSSHAEGKNTYAGGLYSHAEGEYTSTYGRNAHSEGMYTIARGNNQHVVGKYNAEDLNNTYAEIVGIGTSPATAYRKNGRTLDWSGNEQLAGSLTLGLGTTNQTTITAAQLKQLIALLQPQ